jgi:hypothetical protein
MGSGLIIDPAELARIRAACQRRAAELAAAQERQCPIEAPGPTQKLPAALPLPPPIPLAERFAAAVQEMPARVRAFFEREESPYVPLHRRESVGEREQRRMRESVGGWCG